MRRSAREAYTQDANGNGNTIFLFHRGDENTGTGKEGARQTSQGCASDAPTLVSPSFSNLVRTEARVRLSSADMSLMSTPV